MPYHDLHGQPTRHGTANGPDGTTIAWEVYGTDRNNGYPAIACCNGIGCSTFFWHYICRYFAKSTQVLLWDYRGHGDSGLPVDAQRLGMEDNADDLEAVLEAAGLDSVISVGHSMGCQVILEHARRHPKRLKGLVPMLGTYGKATETFFHTDFLARHFSRIKSLVHRFHEPLTKMLKTNPNNRLLAPIARMTPLVNGMMIRTKDLNPYIAHMSMIDIRLFVDMAEHLGTHTTEDYLPSCPHPVLVFGGERDIFTPIWLSEKMHELLPRSEMIMIPGGSHAALVEQPELINLRIEKFIAERVIQGHTTESATALELEVSSDSRAHENDGWFAKS